MKRPCDNLLLSVYCAFKLETFFVKNVVNGDDKRLKTNADDLRQHDKQGRMSMGVKMLRGHMGRSEVYPTRL